MTCIYYAMYNNIYSFADTCKIPDPMDTYVNECNTGYSLLNEDNQPYGRGWTNDSLATLKCDTKPDEYCHR